MLRELRTRRMRRLQPEHRGHYALGRGSMPADARTRRLLLSEAQLRELVGEERAAGETAQRRRGNAFSYRRKQRMSELACVASPVTAAEARQKKKTGGGGA